MEDVTDSPFRQICRAKGADIVFTSEFISSEALIRDSVSRSTKWIFRKWSALFGFRFYPTQLLI
ncbi:MAG: tRNA-dihydrouridine synthase [Balneolaceae bacterium]